MKIQELAAYCDEYLQVDKFKDYCPNGLQIESSNEVNNIVCGVTACEALIDRAIELKADALLVHHGYFWKGEAQPLTGIKGNRIRKLIQNGISLLAYHLPLDAHAVVGNNAQLASTFNAKVKSGFYPHNGVDIGLQGVLDTQQTVQQFAGSISAALDRKVQLIVGDDSRLVKNIAWCSGGAQNAFEQAIELGVDAYISGEVSEHTYHLAKESGVHYLAAGHHATERYGVQALAFHLSNKYGLRSEYVEINNPI